MNPKKAEPPTQPESQARKGISKPALLGGLISANEETFEKILVKLLEKDNVEMKTEVPEPLKLTQLDILGVWCGLEDCPNSSAMISAFCLWFRINMVSNKRQSRKEIVQALSEAFKTERTMTEKLVKQGGT